MVTPDEREFMWDFYAPISRMRLNLGIRRRLAPLLDNDLRRIKVAHSILLTFVGSPVLYYGDEIGMGDNIWLDDRNGVRTPMQWTPDHNAGFSVAAADRLYAACHRRRYVRLSARQRRRAASRSAVALQLAQACAARSQSTSGLRARRIAIAAHRQHRSADLLAQFIKTIAC